MAHPRGPKADPTDRRGGFLHAAGRLVGFVLLVGPAMAAVGAVVLLPPYARLAQRQYRRDCERARTARLEAVSDAQQQLIAALPHDKVLTARLAMRQESLWPEREVVVVDPGRPSERPPGMIPASAAPDPPPPDGVLIRWAAKLADPATRRGLFILAAGTMLAAMLLFAPPSRYRQDPQPVARRFG